MIIDELIALYKYAKARGPRPVKCYIPDKRMSELQLAIEDKVGIHVLGFRPRCTIKGMLVYPTNSGSIWVSG